MITVDILSPVGGLNGGIENVIRLWKQNIDDNIFRLRVIHMSPGIRYLAGFKDVYAFEECEEKDFNKKLQHFVINYASFIKEYGVPDICIATNWPVMCVVADAVKKLMQCDYKVVSWVHSCITEYQVAGLGGVNEMLCADAHFCISKNNENRIVKVDKNAKTYVIGNPVELQEFVENPYDTNTLCYVGRLQDVKRVDVILEALYRAKHKWHFKIIGSGESEQELKEIAQYLGQLNSGQVEFLGWKENPWNECNDAVALVAASEYEGFMLSGAEALSKGMMVISTPVEGLIDYLEIGINGYIFNKEDAVGLAQILDYIYEGVLPLCDRKVCRASVEKYSVNNYFNYVNKILYNIS